MFSFVYELPLVLSFFHDANSFTKPLLVIAGFCLAKALGLECKECISLLLEVFLALFVNVSSVNALVFFLF